MCPGNESLPMDYGWSRNNKLFIPVWFQGSATPDALFLDECICTDSEENIIIRGDADPDLVDEERVDSDKAWSEDSEGHILKLHLRRSSSSRLFLQSLLYEF